MKNIAILTDSGTNVPQEYVERYGIHVLPLGINYAALSYRDRVDITAEQVIDRLDLEVPKTSLPSVEEVLFTLRQIRAQGIRQVLAVTISSGLSGTYSMFRMVAKEFEELDVRVIDTRNIGIGAGAAVIRAAELAARGLGLDDVEKRIRSGLQRTRVFFCVDTLKYLQKGGRIGLVTAAVGSLLGIRPVISCNDDGVYYMVKKARGAKAALDAAMDQVVRLAEGQSRFDLLVAHAGAEKRANAAAAALAEKLPNHRTLIFTPVSPALVVHTGPGLVGIGIYAY